MVHFNDRRRPIKATDRRRKSAGKVAQSDQGYTVGKAPRLRGTAEGRGKFTRRAA